jgi:hypothetical protein
MEKRAEAEGMLHRGTVDWKRRTSVLRKRRNPSGERRERGIYGPREVDSLAPFPRVLAFWKYSLHVCLLLFAKIPEAVDSFFLNR